MRGMSDVPFGGTSPVDEPLTRAETYGMPDAGLWKLVRFVAMKEPDRVAHYDELRWLKRRRREVRREVLRAQNRQRGITTPKGSLSLTEALSALQGVKKRGEHKWVAKCPVHDDNVASLVVFEHSDKPDVPVLYCSAGCDWREIRSAIQTRS